ncbi:MAG: aminotransferase class IV [Bacillota bacterium]
MKVYVNGSFVQAEEARVSVSDAGFLVGYGAFETMRAYGAKVFRIEAHLQRLNETCAVMDIPFRCDSAWAGEVIGRLLNHNDLTGARIRLTVTPGVNYGLSEPTVVVTAVPLSDGRTDIRGWSACISETRVNSRDLLLQHKTTSYVEKLLARRAAQKKGFDEALFLNEKGCVTEGAATNIFCVLDGTLRTPPTAEGLLPGITRTVVADIAANSGIRLIEQPLSINDLKRSEEAFLTNSIVEIVPLIHIENEPIGDGQPGPLTVKLRQAYRDLVTLELGLGS